MAHKLTRRRFLEVAGTIAGSFALAGCSPKNQDPNSIYVGVMGPFTGDVAQYGLAVRSGVLLYLKEFNKKGGVNGRQIVLLLRTRRAIQLRPFLSITSFLTRMSVQFLETLPQRPPLHWHRNRYWTTSPV